MKIRTLLFVICILFVFLIPRSSQPCTTFCLDNDDQLVVGKNIDWPIGDALIIVNKRNVSKTAMTIPEDSGQPASWTSKYGSITFNHGREFPLEGINEAGMVIEMLILPKTEYPAPDARPYIGHLQWGQYQLDNFSTVEEVIASDSQLRISPNAPKFHFLVSDSMGNCAIIEFIDGKMVCYTNKTMPVKVMTNNTYALSIAFLYEHDGWGGELPIPQGESSLDRFVRAADMVRDYDPDISGPTVDYAFDILAYITQSGYYTTQSSIAYDIQNLRIYFHTRENEQIRYFDLNSFDFSCNTPVKVLDIKEDLSGDVSNDFINYTYEINRALIEKLIEYVDIEIDIDIVSHYPETTICTELDCFIATAAYGSTIEPQVEVLREFRDRFLLDNRPGKIFVHFYNTYSPPLADFIARNDNLRTVMRLGLSPIVGMSWITLRLGLIPTTSLLILLLLTLILSTLLLTPRKRVER